MAGFVCFTLRWSCSTRLFKYWLERTFTRRAVCHHDYQIP